MEQGKDIFVLWHIACLGCCNTLSAEADKLEVVASQGVEAPPCNSCKYSDINISFISHKNYDNYLSIRLFIEHDRKVIVNCSMK